MSAGFAVLRAFALLLSAAATAGGLLAAALALAAASSNRMPEATGFLWVAAAGLALLAAACGWITRRAWSMRPRAPRRSDRA